MSENLVKVTIDDVELDVPAGTLVIRAAEQAGIRSPRFCHHPLLEPVAACRQCLVEVGMPDRNTGELRFMPKPQPSCAQTVTPGMVVKTQHTSEVARRAQECVMEFLLINHPLDCPICDKGGECPLQNQAMSEGRESSRFIDAKRTYRKPLKLTSQILLDRERCILCQRCVRFGKEIAGDPFLDLQGRGGGTAPTEHHHFMGEQVGSFDTAVLDYFNPQEKDNVKAGISGPYGQEGIIGSLNEGDLAPNDRDVSGRAFASYFSGNIIQICPVGALTSNDYRFRARPFDLVSTASVTEHDASGSAIRVDIRRGEVLRRLAGNDPEVNEEWITDKDRFAFKWSGVQRLNTPFVRENGQLVPTSWSDALDRVHRALAGLSGDQVGFLPGGRLSFEDAWAWSKFARSVVGSDSIDMRSRSHNEEERSFLAAHVAGRGLGVTYSQLESAGQVLLVGLEPEDECGAIFLRMRKATRKGKLRVASLAPMTSRGLAKLSGELLRCAPGTEVEVAAEIREGGEFADLASRLDGGVILLGERASRTPGLLSEVVRLAERTHCRIQWVPRRAGERGGVEAGLLPGLLPFGRALASQEARESLAWGEIPAQRGLDATQMLEAAADGRVKALVVGGVDLRDFDDPAAARKALDQVDFLVSLEVRRSEVTDRADVILPVAPPLEKNGTFINWEGRLRPFGQAIASRSQTDRLVFDALASEFGVDLGLHDLVGLYDQVNPLMKWNGQREEFVPAKASELVEVGQGEALLATHKPMLDAGRLQDGATMLAGSARRPVVFASRATVAGLGIDEGEELTLSTQRGSITLPLQFADLPDGVVWVPECSQGSIVHESLGNFGSSVTLSAKGEVAR